MCIKNISVQHSLDKNETATMFFLKKPFLVIFCKNIRAFTNLKFYIVKKKRVFKKKNTVVVSLFQNWVILPYS